MLAYLAKTKTIDGAFVDDFTTGAEAALAQVAGQTVTHTAAVCGLTDGAVEQFFDWFAKTERVVTLYSQGINQSSSGVDKVNAIINCHLLTGRIGKPGMGPFSLTGQPNAMGGREVGGLANQLAAHMEIENPQHRDLVQRFWRSPVIADKAGLKAVEMFDAMADGRIKAVWIMSTNPLVSLPDVNCARAALDACDLVVVSDCMRHTDTTRHGHVLLPRPRGAKRTAPSPIPSAVSPGNGRSCRRPARAPIGGTSAMSPAAWDLGVSTIRCRRDLSRACSLSGFENHGARDFDLSALSTLDDRAYDALAPVQWPVTREYPTGTPRLFETGGFFTPIARRALSRLCRARPGTRPAASIPWFSTPAGFAINGTP